ncbi:MAG: NAD(P)-binding domain-containing protein [Cyanobacteria bacterium J06558_2]
MKLAVIGCGYIGSAVAQLWHQAGHDVIVTTTTPEKIANLQSLSNQVVVLTGNELPKLQQIVADRDVVLLSVGSKQRTPEIYRCY